MSLVIVHFFTGKMYITIREIISKKFDVFLKKNKSLCISSLCYSLNKKRMTSMDAKYYITDSDISNTIVYNSVVHIATINNAAILGQNKIWVSLQYLHVYYMEKSVSNINLALKALKRIAIIKIIFFIIAYNITCSLITSSFLFINQLYTTIFKKFMS